MNISKKSWGYNLINRNNSVWFNTEKTYKEYKIKLFETILDHFIFGLFISMFIVGIFFVGIKSVELMNDGWMGFLYIGALLLSLSIYYLILMFISYAVFIFRETVRNKKFYKKMEQDAKSSPILNLVD